MHVKGESLFTPNRESVTEQLQRGLVSLQSADGRSTSDKVSGNKVLLLSTSSSTDILDSDSVKVWCDGTRFFLFFFFFFFFLCVCVCVCVYAHCYAV